MSWLAKLYETYDHIDSEIEQNSLWPISHFVKNAHIEVVIDSNGVFLVGRSKVLNGEESPTLIPATESSAGRSGAKVAPHPLCEEIGYCAADHPDTAPVKASAYLDQLKEWVESVNTHPKLKAIYKYLQKNNLWSDLSSELEFPLKVKKRDGSSQKISVEKVFIRWRVEEFGNPVSGTWEDKALIDAWTAYDLAVNSKIGFCSINGREERIALNHPRFIRWPGDGAKLISSNDHSGFTFRGRFTDSKTSIDKNGLQTVSIGFVPTQKAHNALRWLLERQGFRNDEQVYLTWAISGKSVPDPLKNTLSLFEQPIVLQEPVAEDSVASIDHGVDLGESFARKFNKYLSGYRAVLDMNEQIVIMGLDSATPGRMAITYYRELTGSEFHKRIVLWHGDFAWHQNYGKDSCFIGAPSPKDIAWAAHCTKLGGKSKADINNKLSKTTIERLLPCIVDGVAVPKDLVESSVRRVSNRLGLDVWEWEKCLGIACSLYKGTYRERRYEMALEEDRITRDYLYGRLLAVAEQLESMALFFAGERRETTAARLMQRFSDRPFSTWKTIEDSLVPYKARIQSKASGLLDGYKEILDQIHDLFAGDDYVKDNRLSGEYLLGYHCQRKWLRDRKRVKGQWILKETIESECQEFDEISQQKGA